MTERVIRISSSEYVKCPTCQGRGTIKCLTCNGTGLDPNDIFGPITGRPKLCRVCRGRKIIRCPNCGGTGRVKLE